MCVFILIGKLNNGVVWPSVGRNGTWVQCGNWSRWCPVRGSLAYLPLTAYKPEINAVLPGCDSAMHDVLGHGVTTAPTLVGQWQPLLDPPRGGSSSVHVSDSSAVQGSSSGPVGLSEGASLCGPV